MTEHKFDATSPPMVMPSAAKPTRLATGMHVPWVRATPGHDPMVDEGRSPLPSSPAPAEHSARPRPAE